MNIKDAKYKMRVAYIPRHARDNIEHKDVEHGAISSTTGDIVFVRFDEEVEKLGWNETTAQPCSPDDLIIL